MSVRLRPRGAAAYLNGGANKNHREEKKRSETKEDEASHTQHHNKKEKKKQDAEGEQRRAFAFDNEASLAKCGDTMDEGWRDGTTWHVMLRQ